MGKFRVFLKEDKDVNINNSNLAIFEGTATLKRGMHKPYIEILDGKGTGETVGYRIHESQVIVWDKEVIRVNHTGVEDIYEYDIVEIYNDREDPYRLHVKHNGDRYMLIDAKGSAISLFEACERYNIRVIGNMLLNKELMEV